MKLYSPTVELKIVEIFFKLWIQIDFMRDQDPYGDRCGTMIRIRITTNADPHHWKNVQKQIFSL